ncbi:MAG: RluA family pseudouridine synthase [Chitinivibrionales bacterium]|nr:RluA family pseudouridine synthase [Chitinivibrionales bacterium]
MKPSRHKSVVVDKAESGMRLDQFAAQSLENHSRATVQKCIESGIIRINGNHSKKNVRLKTGDLVTIDEDTLMSITSEKLVPQDIDISVLFEDEFMLAVNKPAGMVVHPGSGNRDGTLANALAYRMPSLSDGFTHDRPGIVHRLDKHTSGILLIAKTNQTHAALAALFSERSITKQYIGICIGNRPQEHGILEAPVGRSRSDPVKHVIKNSGKYAKTEYRLLKYESGISVLQFRLHTGRTHQIRIHTSHAGFPIVADELYGGGRDRVKRTDPLSRPFASSVFKCFSRHALHAHRLIFIHPFTGKKTDLSSPVPDDMLAAMNICGVTKGQARQEIEWNMFA